MHNLAECKDIRDIAEVNSEKIADERLADDDDVDVFDGFQGADEEMIGKNESGNGAKRIVRKHSEVLG